MDSHGGTRQDFLNFLKDQGELDAPGVARVTSLLQNPRQQLEDVILELGLMSESKFAALSSSFLGYKQFQAADIENLTIDVSIFPLSYQKAANVAVVDCSDRGFQVLTSTPFQFSHINAMSFQTGLTADVKITERALLSELFSFEFKADINSDHGYENEVAHENDLERLKDAARDAPTVKLLNRLIIAALDLRATDIHFEPQEDRLNVRYRIDGTLQLEESVPLSYRTSLVSRIKVLANLNIAETRIPQDGRIKITLRGQNIDLRISTAPVVHGESVALRILNRNELPLDLHALGFKADGAKQIEKLTRAPNGMVLITGPTGSGKTTTLYAILSILNHPSKKLFSIEDPVEYRLTGVNQIQVKPQIDLDFASVLRSVLRQDPDIIMVGEMRDAETASIAVKASMTGHLVLSTLHTNSAVGAISRLRDMGIENYMLAATLRGVVAQRLVRCVCKTCKGRNGSQQHMNSDTCSTCKGSGFFGRTTVYEILEITSEMRSALAQGCTEAELALIAKKNGMRALNEQGQSLVDAGLTNQNEVNALILET